MAEEIIKQSAAVSEPQKTVRPTKKQYELLGFIEEFINTHGYSPSYREIMTGLNYTSVATVSLHVNSLIDRGHLRKRGHSARSLEVVKPTTEKKLVTKQLNTSQEKWLVDKVEVFFKETEAMPNITEKDLDNLYVLLGSMKVLGLEGAANSFSTRLAALKARIGATEYSV